ncbi:hypothetical protein ARMSODRAFT_444074 [Armillaria solidipes]|uniref:Uncharacterized protein n=1 Tax=Armillaria solidipes TaxID=1076256 RepID=A0A2H3BPY0_9AGAR|nr:hypothetical protein ARMSODRAFT_444074 [Armillaria solidipes]
MMRKNRYTKEQATVKSRDTKPSTSLEAKYKSSRNLLSSCERTHETYYASEHTTCTQLVVIYPHTVPLIRRAWNQKEYTRTDESSPLKENQSLAVPAPKSFGHKRVSEIAKSLLSHNGRREEGGAMDWSAVNIEAHGHCDYGKNIPSQKVKRVIKPKGYTRTDELGP